MKFEHFQQIIERIERDVPCPQCGAFFDHENIEIKDVQSRHIDFSVSCTSCGANVVIGADVEPVFPALRKMPLQRDFSRRSKPQTQISEEEIHSLSEVLKKFHGHDVRELF